MTSHGYGWVFDDHDDRDHRVLTAPALGALPRRVDLRETPHMPPIWDQLPLGSCTAHAALRAFLYRAAADGIKDPMLSRLQLYWRARQLMDPEAIHSDTGARIRDSIKAAALGIGAEEYWPYDIARFAEMPPDSVNRSARYNRAITYSRPVHSLTGIMAALNGGFPVVDGMPVYESMESPEAADTGYVPMPEPGENLMGFHATATVGYDLDLSWKVGTTTYTGALIKANSWGADWGEAGYFYLPLQYRQFLSDRWIITSVS